MHLSPGALEAAMGPLKRPTPNVVSAETPTPASGVAARRHL